MVYFIQKQKSCTNSNFSISYVLGPTLNFQIFFKFKEIPKLINTYFFCSKLNIKPLAFPLHPNTL